MRCDPDTTAPRHLPRAPPRAIIVVLVADAEIADAGSAEAALGPVEEGTTSHRIMEHELVVRVMSGRVRGVAGILMDSPFHSTVAPHHTTWFSKRPVV